jgi:regulator of RNase E activity RraA
MSEWNLEEIRARMLKMPTTVVADAMDACGLPNNTVSGVRPTWPDCPSIMGTALTVRNIPAGSRTQVVHGAFKASDCVKPGDVVVIANDGDVENNGWGGLASWGSKLRGAVGTIVDGAARDVDEFEEMGYPVYTKGLVCRTGRGRMVQESINHPVRFGGTQIHPGDIIYADKNGICVIPPEKVLDVLANAEEINARESKMVEDMKAGLNAIEASKAANYEDMLKKH